MNMMTRQILILISLIFISSTLTWAEDSSSIQGRVTAQESGKALAGANIQIRNTYIGTSSDENGYFRLTNVPAGSVELSVSYIGYKSKTVQLDIGTDPLRNIHVALTETLFKTEQVVVTASRQPEELASAVSSIDVLAARDIRQRNSARLDEALLSVPGVTLVGENINIRGGSGYNRLGGNRTLVLIDEVPVLTSDLGAANWNILPVSQVDHIEVLKGAASSQYGSGALSGVINIITKGPSQSSHLSLQQSSGMFDDPSVPEWKWTDELRYFHRTDVGYSNSFGPVGLRLALSRHQSTGDRQNGQFERWTMTAKARWQLAKQSSLTLFSTYSMEERELFLQWLEQDRALMVPPPELGNNYELDGYVGYLQYHNLFSPTLSTKIRLSYNQQLVGIPVNIENAFTPAIGLGGELQVHWTPHINHNLSLGMDYKRDDVQSEYYGKRSANGFSPYAQHIWKVSERIQMNTGLRWDTYTLVGDSVEMQLSPRAGISFQPVYGTIIHGSIGRGFRAATVVERFISVGGKDFRAVPNPDLQPERSVLLELGVRQHLGSRAYMEVNLFSSTYKNLIEPTLFADLSAQFINYPAARIRGVEAEYRWQILPKFLSMQTSATWLDARELETDTFLPYRPHFSAYFSPEIEYGPFLIRLDFRYASRLKRVTVYPLDERVPTKVWNFHFIYQRENFDLEFHINNALNYNYTVSERVLGEIRHFMLTFRTEIYANQGENR
ncbi:TonB-dependent receptor [candidate division KSB1 bacterium]|nr:TonB-dependent receptor [candidate division KSB1 bacterium]